MKVISKEEYKEYNNAVLLGGLKGASLGVAVGLTGLYVGIKRFPKFARLPIGVKSIFFMCSSLFGLGLGAELAGTDFEDKRYGNTAITSFGTSRIGYIDEHGNAKATALARTLDYVKNNQVKVIFGSWAACISGCMYFIWKDKLLDPGQKIIHARIYAQGFTIALLVGSVFWSFSGDKAERDFKETGQKVELDPTDPSKSRYIVTDSSHPGWKKVVDEATANTISGVDKN